MYDISLSDSSLKSICAFIQQGYAQTYNKGVRIIYLISSKFKRIQRIAVHIFKRIQRIAGVQTARNQSNSMRYQCAYAHPLKAYQCAYAHPLKAWKQLVSLPWGWKDGGPGRFCVWLEIIFICLS